MSQTFVRLLKDGHPDTGLSASNLIEAEAFTGDDKTERIHDFFVSDDEQVSAGVWECAPCRAGIKRYPVNEMMTILAGSVTLTRPDGTSETFTSGDTFFVPKGTPCVWHVTEHLRKFYMCAP